MARIRKTITDLPKMNFVEIFKADKVREEDLKFERFDEYVEDEDNELVGHAHKTFLRADSAALSKFIKEITTNPTTAYVTCFDEVKTEMIPKKISVLKKFVDVNDRHFSLSIPSREASASKIINFMGAPTSYNFVIERSSKVTGKKEKLRPHLASVDFISPGEKFYSFEDFDIKWDHNIKKMIDNITKLFMSIQNESTNNKKTVNVSDEQKQKYIDKAIEDFVLSYLIRTLLLWDGDFHMGNIGFLYNEETKEIKIVNFDLEFSMQSSTAPIYYSYSVNYIRKKYPQVYNKFIEKVHILEKNMTKEQIEKTYFTNDSVMMTQLYYNAKDIMFKHRLYEGKKKVFNFLRRKKSNETTM